LGQLIDLGIDGGGQGAAAQDAGALHALEPLREDIGAEAFERAADLAEAPRPEQQLARDQQRPAFADKIHCQRRPAGVAVPAAHLAEIVASYFL
jgi:hypothetical protein